jgi:hypothetical protein
MLLADDILIEMSNDFPGRWNLIKQLLAWTTTLLLLIQNGLAQLDAFTADIDIARTFYKRSYIAIALATKRTKSILLGCATAAPTTGHDILTLRHTRLLSFCCDLLWGLSHAHRSQQSPT